jgi:dienelactone hydrolase
MMLNGLMAAAIYPLLAWGPPPALPTRLVEEGTFAITIGGRSAGSERFSLIDVGANRELRTTTQFAARGVTQTIKGRLQMDQHWAPLGAQFDWRTGGQSSHLTLSRWGDLPELTTQTGRSLVYTRPSKPADLFLLYAPTVVAHLLPLCQLAGAKEQTFTAFPAATLHLGPVETQAFPENKVGAPARSLTVVVATLAETTRLELVCDGPKLVAVRSGGQGVVAVRASYEAVASTLEARAARSKPPLPADLADLERHPRVPAASGSPATTLRCDLLIPRGYADLRRGPRGQVVPTAAPVNVGGARYLPEVPPPLPAVLLLGDAAAEDADGDPVDPGYAKLSLLKRLAIRLGERGIASLRCDDRDARPRFTGARPSLEALASDARALLAALGREPAIDPGRLGIAGHGQGGLVAALVAQKDPSVRALAFLGTAARPLDALVLAEAEQSMRRFGYPEREIAAALDQQRAFWASVRAGRLSPKLPRSEQVGARQAFAWMRSHLAHPPAAELARLRPLPTFIAQGGRDVQVPPEDAEALRRALAAGQGQPLVKTYPQLNHSFASAPADRLADYTDPRAELSEEFLQDLAGFAHQSLAAAPGLANARR